MIIDNLTIAGILVTSLYLVVPLWFRGETWKVDEAPEANREPGVNDNPAIGSPKTCLDC